MSRICAARRRSRRCRFGRCSHRRALGNLGHRRFALVIWNVPDRRGSRTSCVSARGAAGGRRAATARCSGIAAGLDSGTRAGNGRSSECFTCKMLAKLHGLRPGEGASLDHAIIMWKRRVRILDQNIAARIAGQMRKVQTADYIVGDGKAFCTPGRDDSRTDLQNTR